MGFRGNWVVRKGGLREDKDHGNLVVEKHSYDGILKRFPFYSFPY